ncbi:glycosyltransferase family 2 protein [Brachyspira pulli]|uniref:glycosyltransferase family 2 protein n=1 Tax=Brachyspira pulli TaxID=310721 RepID=UPI003004676D
MGFFYNKYDDGIYRVRNICGIKITTKPLENKINLLLSQISEMKLKIDNIDVRTINTDVRTINIENQVNNIPYFYRDIKVKLNHIASEEYNYDRNIFNNIKPPYISIIVPIYNIGKEYLVNCLNSLVNQTLKEIEIILVNDCSPNEEDDLICKEYALKDKRIKYIKHKENKGSGGARMTGLKEATGYAIGFVDPDDIVALNAYEITVSRMVLNNVDIVCFNWFRIDNNYNMFDVDINIPQFVYGKDIIHLLSIEKMHACVLDKIYKRELLDKLGYDFMPEKISSQDMVANFKIFSISNSLEYINKQLYYYRKRDDSVTGKFDDKVIIDKHIAIENIYKFVKNNNLISLTEDMYNFFVTFYCVCCYFINVKLGETKNYEQYDIQVKLVKQLIVDNIRDGYITEEIFLDICNKRNLWFLINLYNS